MRQQTEADKRLIQDLFDDMMKSFKRDLTEEQSALIKRAFEFANKAHFGIKRKSGEPYIIHPLAVAKIVVKDIGLGSTAAVAAILHDVVEDTDYTLDDMTTMFGAKVSSIVDGLTKVKGNVSPNYQQATNFKKMLLTLSEDVRVIFIKLADRLHNMRTLDSMPRHKQLKISGETLYVFAPLAHRLGLSSIKRELEDLSFKYKHPEIYNELKLQIDSFATRHKLLVDEFCSPIIRALDNRGATYTIASRTKSPYSTWQKMKRKGLPFEEIYDLIAIRIIIDPLQNETDNAACFATYSIVKGIYNKEKHGRMRDWVNSPKANNYRAIHNTLMDRYGNWFEMQIRTYDMDRVAEQGLAAHYHYKEKAQEAEEVGGDSASEEGNRENTQLDIWLDKVKEVLKNPDSNALDFLDDFKLNLYSDEIVVFTPKGDMKTLPSKATVLDFAYEIHSALGNRCIGAKINHKLVPPTQTLSSGDQIEILTSNNHTPKPEWIDIVNTSNAKSKIREAITKLQKAPIHRGKDIIHKIFLENNFDQQHSIRKLISHYKVAGKNQLYLEIGSENISEEDIIKSLSTKEDASLISKLTTRFGNLYGAKGKRPITKRVKGETFYIETGNKDYIEADCCTPLPGDAIMGVVLNDEVIIHKRSCPESIKAMANNGESVIDASWRQYQEPLELTKILINGFDRQGMIKDITDIITTELNLNIRSLKLSAHDTIFEGEIELLSSDKNNKTQVINRLKRVKGVNRIIDTINN